MPEESRTSLQMCPTRVDGAPVLFAHKVTQAQCQDRQRGHYHKCFTCAFNNAFVARNGKPAAATQAGPARVQVG
jgi:hypothetical protein